MSSNAALAPAPDRCPKYLGLARGFERQLRAGALRVGDRLPSVRRLREQHRISAATAVSCYMWLERQGYVRAHPRSGFFVSRLPWPDTPEPSVAGRTRGPVPVRLVSPGAEISASGRLEPVQLGPAVIGSALLPRQRLNRSLRLALSAFPDNAVHYEDPRGNPRLRRQIARVVFRQGAACSPDDVLVTSGETEATNLAVRAVTRPGDVVAVESPGCYEFLQALGTFRVRAVEIPHVRRQGIDLERLRVAVDRHRIKAILVTATCHNALGDCASDESKQELVAFATERGVPIIEGDPFGDLVFSGERPRPLKAFDTAGVVIQCCSLAHYVAPGFNLGWTCAGRWHAEVERLKLAANVASASLPQLAMAEFLESGAYDKHVKQLRLALWQSVEASRQEILRTFPAGTRVSRPEGGFVLWVQLPEGHDALELQQQAAGVGVNILAGALFTTTRQYDHSIRIACGHPFEVMKPALGTLARLLAG